MNTSPDDPEDRMTAETPAGTDHTIEGHRCTDGEQCEVLAAANETQRCTYCGGDYPQPVELHHSQEECTSRARLVRVVIEDGRIKESFTDADAVLVQQVIDTVLDEWAQHGKEEPWAVCFVDEDESTP